MELLYWSETNPSLRNISVYTINPDDLNNLEITINIYGYLDNNIFPEYYIGLLRRLWLSHLNMELFISFNFLNFVIHAK